MGFFDRALRELGKVGGAVLETGLQAIPDILGGLLPGPAPLQIPRGPIPPPFRVPRAAPLDLPIGGPSMAMNLALPGGAPVIQAGFGDVFGGAIGALLGSGAALTPSGATCPTLFRQTPMTLRAVSSFHITNPSTGKEVFYRNVGRPILFSGDLRVCKTVEKIARRAKRASGKR